MHSSPPRKTVLITGTSTGFGLATARLFASRGWQVVASMRHPERAAAELRALPDQVLITRLDVQDAASIQTAVAQAIARFGAIDVLINNAGFSLFGVFEGITPDKLRQQFDVNLFGAMEVTRAALPHMRERHRGVVINVSSGAGVFGLPMLSLYNASKFALEGWSESLSYELASQGLRVKIVEPGGVTSTAFGQRMAQEAAQSSAPTDYAGFEARAHEAFAELRRSRRHATSEDVAQVLWEAATDETDRLRYVATEDIKAWVTARREAGEEAYLALMRAHFADLAKPAR